MNKLIIFLIAGVVVILIGWSLVQMNPLQTPDGTMKDDMVRYDSGSESGSISIVPGGETRLIT